MASWSCRRARLQALIERGGLAKLPPSLDEVLAEFLGSGRRYFWPAPRSLSAAVRAAFERPVILPAVAMQQSTAAVVLSSCSTGHDAGSATW